MEARDIYVVLELPGLIGRRQAMKGRSQQAIQVSDEGGGQTLSVQRQLRTKRPVRWWHVRCAVGKQLRKALRSVLAGGDWKPSVT
jgi:hypothetical protein